MSDSRKPPFTPSAPLVLPSERHPSGTGQPAPRPGVIVLPAVRPAVMPLPVAQPAADSGQNAQNGAQTPAQGPSWTSTYGRPLDVNGDVQQTSGLVPSPPLQAARNSDGAALVLSGPPGRQMDVQNPPAQTAIAVAHGARTTKQPRRSKQRKKADLDQDRGRFRHTIRLEPKVEQKLRTVAEILGIDLNAAIAVCVSVHHHRLTKSGSGDS